MKKALYYVGVVITLMFLGKSTFAQNNKSTFVTEHPQAGVTVISNDTGNWGGNTLGNTHQNAENYWAEKIIEVSANELAHKKYARLRVYFGVIDYSTQSGVKHNGLDESFRIVINGHSHNYQTSESFLRGDPKGKKSMYWTDFDVPINELKAGKNTVIIHKNKSEKEKNDDFIYVGIDNTVPGGFSRMSNDSGKTWRGDDLNLAASQAPGEYMVRLVLLDENPHVSAVWTPTQKIDTHSVIGYVGTDSAEGQPALDVELDSFKIDYSQPINVAIKADKSTKIKWFDDDAKEIDVKSTFINGVYRASLNDGIRLAKAQISPANKNISAIKEVRFDYSVPVGSAQASRINMAPRIHAAKGKPANRAPKVLLSDDGFIVQNATQIAQYQTKPHLRLTSLRNEYLQKNVLVCPEQTHLFLTEIDGKRYGAEDWIVRDVKVLSSTKIQINLTMPNVGLGAAFTVSVDAQKMIFGLEMKNDSPKELTWKTAFPQIGGVELSQSADDDAYLFPLYGGAIASKNVNLRTYYGDGTAWWQMVDLFSPEGGAGMALRNLDETGLYKGVAMRKGLSTIAGFAADVSGGGMSEEMGWKSSLETGPGTAVGFEYLQYTRGVGKSLALPDSAVEMHAGDWHDAMQTYADWAHRVWKWRPFPSKLQDVWNIFPVGWGWGGALFKDGKYRTDYINDSAEISELMSWWEWSDYGPWNVPMEQVREVLGDALADRYRHYFIENPATGKVQDTLNRGDYYYNETWGGLPALKKQLQAIRDGGQIPTFYTDPLLVYADTDLGKKYGEKYGVMNPLWKDPYGKDYKRPVYPEGYVATYSSWNMCLDAEWYQHFAAEQTARIAKDTGIDGIRLDQFGNRGFACFNPQHHHVFAEKGQNAWLQSQARISQLTHEAIDKFNPDFILMSEFPGNDHLSANLEGHLNYESSTGSMPEFRPVPLNIFRFYFPESKPFDLNNKHNPRGIAWQFWNASGTFRPMYPPLYQGILKENGDAFNSREMTPLVPTLQENIYANQFKGGGKTITQLYNAKGFTVDGALLKADSDANYHYFDLLNGKEITPQNGVISLKLGADKVVTVAQLPKVLSVKGNEITLSRIPKDAAIVLCNAEGKVLSRQKVSGQKVLLLDLSTDMKQIKLLSGNYLVDATSLSN